jgi:hypothetical protein
MWEMLMGMEVGGKDSDSDAGSGGIMFPPAAVAVPSWKETNAFHVVAPFMKEYLGLLELADRKESKIKSLVNVMSNLIIEEKKNQLERQGINSNKDNTHVCCQVPHDKHKRLKLLSEERSVQSSKILTKSHKIFKFHLYTHTIALSCGSHG